MSADVHRCEDCGAPTNESIGDSYWLADDDLWNRVVRTDTIVLCTDCFTIRARATGVRVSWRAVEEPEATALQRSQS